MREDNPEMSKEHTVIRGEKLLRYGWGIAFLGAILNFYWSTNFYTRTTTSFMDQAFYYMPTIMAQCLLMVSIVFGLILLSYKRWVAGLMLIIGSIVLSFLGLLIPSLKRIFEHI